MDSEEARLVKQDAARHMDDPIISDITTVAAARAAEENEGAVDWASELPAHPRTHIRATHSIDQVSSQAHLGWPYAHNAAPGSVDLSTPTGRRALLVDPTVPTSDSPAPVCTSIETLKFYAQELY